MRSLIETRLRGTRPGGDPFESLLHGATPEQQEVVRRSLTGELADAAVLVPIVERESGLTVLLTLRASHLKNHAGQISFPGGRIESEDAGPWEAALREAREEIGLAPEFVRLAGYLNDQMVISGFRVTPAVGFVRPGFELRLDRTEVEDVFEVPLEFVLDPANHVPRNRHFQGMSFVTYDIPYEGRQIWGATATMLVTLYRMLREA